MALVMPSPRKHPVTGIFEHFRRVPADLAERVKGKEVAVPVAGERRTIRLGTHAKVTLSTRDPAEAKRRFAAVVEALDAFYASTRSGPVRMNHRQRQAVAGEVYKGLVAASADDPGSADHWREKAALLRQHVTEANSDPETRALALEMLVAPTVDDALAARGLSVTEESRRELLDDAAHFLALAFRDAEAMARRDYTMRSVPTWTDSDPAASAPPKPDRDGLTFSAIIDEEERLRTLGKDAKGIPAATLAKFRRECASLAAHRGTDDATTLTTAAVRSWIEALQEEGRLSNRTIGNSLTDIGAVRRWGVRQNEAAFAGAPDPFKGVRKPGFEDAEAGARTYTMAEARTILKAARKEHRAERRWLALALRLFWRPRPRGRRLAQGRLRPGGRDRLFPPDEGRRKVVEEQIQRTPRASASELEGGRLARLRGGGTGRPAVHRPRRGERGEVGDGGFEDRAPEARAEPRLAPPVPRSVRRWWRQ